MFAFNLWGVNFADRMSGGGEVAIIHPGSIRVEVHEAKRLEQLLQFDKHLTRPIPEHIGQNNPGEMINCMPQPPLLGFTPHETPHLIDLRRLYTAHFYRDRLFTSGKRPG
jgi:hypothetical protein